MSFMPEISQFPSPVEGDEKNSVPAVEELEAYLMHPEAEMRRLIVFLLKKWGAPLSVPGLLRVAMDSDSRVREAAWQALEEFGNGIEEALVESLESPFVEVRLAAVIVLRERGVKQARHASFAGF